MDQVSWLVREGTALLIVKIPRGSSPSNGIGLAPEGFEPGDERFISLHANPTGFVLSIDFDSWRESRKPKDNFFTRMRAGWKA